MPIRTIASVVIATVLGLAGSREPHLRAGQSDLAFSLHRGFLIVLKGQVGFMEGLTFILDTGTVRSIVDLRIARALGLRGSSSQILSFNSAIAAEEIVVPSIRLGPFSVVSPTVLAADLSALTNTQGVTPDGIVGLDVLRGRCFTIDYSAQRVLFRPHARWDASLRFDRQSPYLVVNTLVDSIPFRVIVDTGAEGMLLFERAIPRTWVPRPGWAGRMGIEHCFHTDANYLRRMGVEFIGEVSFDQAIQWMTRGIFNPVLYGPLFRHLGMVTCRTFETPAAGTIPIFDLNREYVIEIYGERAAELLLPADNGR